TPGEAIKASREYLLVCGVGILFIVGYNVINSILSGMGDATTPFLFVLVACFINVVLDVILVRYARLGALGAAIATTAAQGGSFLFALIYLRIKGIGFTFGREDIRISGREAKKLFSIGAPVAVQNMLVGVSFLFITAIINQMGLIASASVGVVEKLITFMFVPVTAFATAVGAAASQNLGAGQEKRAKKCMWCGIGMALVPAILITVFCQFEAEMLTGILAKSPEVVKMSARYLESYIFDILMVSFVFCMNGYFNSLNKSWFSLLHSLLATFGVRIPLSFVLSRMVTADLYLIGFASPASTLVSLIICVPFLWKLNKKI
ncbi:polysaccharide biosynthesis C-terminal domain-containing protein, partial [Lachnospiraceae bacterium OttesenSCG-928-E19]|nr:polysaccharide biosynthesis C-terminal domain-containing protein [Lachnospiraceae bacterium OttesenSCG-928-E19]